MTSFLAPAAAALLAFVFLASGVGHVVGWRGFRRLLAEHEVLPRRLVMPASLGVPIAELAAGAGALALVLGEVNLSARLVFALALVLAASFSVYLVRLFRHRPATAGCGCSPLAGPLTLASLAPATAAVAAAAAGLLVDDVPPVFAARLLPMLWGTLLGGLVLLLPATVPAPSRVRS